MKNQITKGLTLLLFSSLIIGFVVFKSGYLKERKKERMVSSPNGGVLSNIQHDTTKKKKPNKFMLSSSKSMVIDYSEVISDSEINAIMYDTVKKDDFLMYGSKSGKVFEQAPLNSFYDSLYIDRLMKQILNK